MTSHIPMAFLVFLEQWQVKPLRLWSHYYIPVFISTKTKQIFSTTPAGFRFVFSCPHWFVFIWRHTFWYTPKMLMEASVETLYSITVFKALLSPIHTILEKEHFQNDALSKNSFFEPFWKLPGFRQRFRSFLCGRSEKQICNKKVCVFIRKRSSLVRALNFNL